MKKRLTENTSLWLIIIGSMAVVIRSLPAWTNAAWGCDFGIYYGLTKTYLETGEIPVNYNLWGGAYQYFPMIYFIGGIFYQITRIDLILLLPKFVPLFGGLSVIVFYFITREILNNKRLSILSSLFLAVLPFHAYQTSQAAPLTIGHFFLMLSIYFFIKTRKNIRFLPLLIISTLLLIITHHLTTYIYLISLIFIIVFENLSRKEWTASFKFDIKFILLASFLTFAYWTVFAKPVFENFMRTGLKIGSLSLDPYFVILCFYLLILAMLGLILLKRKFSLKFFMKDMKMPYPLLFISVLISSLIVLGIISILNLPWGKIYLTMQSILFVLPFFFILSFSSIGFHRLLSIKNGSFILGWFFAIFISMLYGFFSLNRIILPHRHLEYLMAPLSVMASYGIIESIKFGYPDFTVTKKIYLKKSKLIFSLLVIILIAGNGVSVYPSYLYLEKLEMSYETITNEDIYAMKWINENLDKNTAVIASDHRLSLLANAYGFNTTMDKTLLLWNSTNLSDYINELENEWYGRVTHVIVDDIMRDSVVHVDFNGTKVYMRNETSTAAYDKFLRQPFELIYRNESIDHLTEEPVHWVEIYKINWSCLEDYIKNS